MTPSGGVATPGERKDQTNNASEVFKDCYPRKIKLTDVVFDSKIYPRSQSDTSLISKYRDAIDQLPPIVIDGKNRLIDGYHRLMAYSQEGMEKIEVTIFNSEDDRECLMESIRLNSRHGKQLTRTEKKEMATRLYLQSLPETDISQILSISERTLQNYLRNLKQEELSKRDAEIREMWLSKLPIRKIAEKVGLSKSRVEEIVSGFGNIAETGQPTIPQIFLNWWENLEDPVKDKPKKLPVWVLENFLHKFTSAYDLIMEYGNAQTMSDLQILSKGWQRKYCDGHLQDAEDVPSVILVDIPNSEEVVHNAKESFEDIAIRTEKISDSDQPLIAFTISTDDWLLSTFGLEIESIKNLNEFGFKIVGEVRIIYEMHPSTLEELIRKTQDPKLLIRMESMRIYVIDQTIWLFSRNTDHSVAKMFSEAEVFPKMAVV